VCPATGSWDRLQLEHVLRNLFSNALKYGKGRPIDVAVAEAGRDRDKGAITVGDRGIGIAPEDQARIFERFERAVKPQQFGGFGLGLWIARKLVNAMGGTISVDSRPGEGTTFTVELPRELAPGVSQEGRPALRVV